MRKDMHRIGAIGALTVAALLATSACSEGNPGVNPDTSSATPKAVDAATVSFPAPNQSFDPVATVSATDRGVFSLTSGLLTRATKDGKVAPDLAEKIELSADFKTATATLRPGLKFSDGSALNAEDVVATWQRNMGIQTSVLSAVTGRVQSVAAQGENTVVFTFKAPFPSFEVQLAQPSLGVYPSEGITAGASFFQKPVSAGPYKISSAWASNKLVLEVNPDYWGAKPLVKKVTLTVIEDANNAVSQLQGGQLDFAGDLPPNFLKQLQGSPGITVKNTPVYGFYDLRMWNRSGPFADVNMRKAIFYAVDRDAIVQSIWGGLNKPQAGFWPPTMPGHDASVNTKADLAKAKEFLAKTSCASGCSITYNYSDQEFPFSSQLALLVQDQLKAVGIDLKLEKMDAPTLIERLRSGNYQMVNGAMSAQVNIPDPILGNALLGTGGLKAEFTGYASPEMDALIAQANQSSGAAREAVLKQIEAKYIEDVPFVTLAPWVRGTATRLPADTIAITASGLIVASE